MANRVTELNGKQKAATVLLAVDAETAARVMRNFAPEEVAALAFEMKELKQVEPRLASAVLQEFSIRASADSGILTNPTVVRERVEKALAPDEARNVLKGIGLTNEADALFQPLRELGAEELHKLLADEHPQTVAVVLTQVDAKTASGVIGLFPQEFQVDVVRRMASTKHTPDAMILRVGEIMRQKTGVMREARAMPEDPRYKRVADLLNRLPPETQDAILKKIGEGAPDMAEKLRDMMFVFEDMRYMGDDDMRKILMSIDTQVLAMSLKTASEELRQKVFGNLSRRATETVTEELDLLGPKPLSQVKAAQQKIVQIIRKMSSSGEVKLRASQGEEDPLV